VPALAAVWAQRGLLADKPPSGPFHLERLVTLQEAAEGLHAGGYQVAGVDGLD
jgi:hypothetical protein